MDVRTLIAPVRDAYIKAFERAIHDFRQNRGPHCLLEYSLGQPEEPQEGRFSLPVRHDLLPLVDGRPDSITVIREEKPARIAESVADIGPIPITFRQFTWDQFEMRLAGVQPSADMTPLMNWFDRWFDRIGRRPELPGGLRGVIHSLDGPFWDENGMTIEVDLGTATVDAMIDLIYAVAHLKPTAIEIISPVQQQGATGWNIPAPDDWEPAEEAPGEPITYTKGQSTFRIAVEEGAALNRTMDEAHLADAVRQMAMQSGARKTIHVITGTCPLGLYAATEWRTLEHGTIRLWMLSNRKDMVTASLIGDDLSQRDIKQITDCVMAITPRT